MKSENEIALAEMILHADDTHIRIRELEELIEAEKKPELRHGDYGLWDIDASLSNDNLEFIALEVDDELHWFSRDHSRSTQERDCGPVDFSKLDDFTLIGNIFDDLKAMSEDVRFDEEYEFDGHPLRLLLSADGMVHFRYGGFYTKDITPIRQMLQRMEATLKRREAKA